MRLKDKVVIVTGGGRGIGRAICSRFLREGAKVVVADREVAQAEKTAAQLASERHSITAVHCDISRQEEVRNLVVATLDRYGHIDVLVNNAAIAGGAAIAPFLEMTAEHWDRVLSVNLTGTFYCSQEVARAMVQAGKGGRIINISSISGISVEERASAYCTAKAGVIRLTRAMALELAPYAITVNDIAPGVIPLVDGEPVEVGEQRLCPRQPLRNQGRPEDIAAGAMFLASDEAAFITGITLRIDGGTLCYWFKYDS